MRLCVSELCVARTRSIGIVYCLTLAIPCAKRTGQLWRGGACAGRAVALVPPSGRRLRCYLACAFGCPLSQVRLQMPTSIRRGLVTELLGEHALIEVVAAVEHHEKFDMGGFGDIDADDRARLDIVGGGGDGTFF